MASTYRLENMIKGKAATVAVAASKTDEVVSDPISRTAEDSLNTRVRLEFSSATEVTGITFDIQHSYKDDEWEDVGSQAQVAMSSNSFADADVASATELITVTAHGWATGNKVQYDSSAGNDVTGLTDGTAYFVIKSTADAIKLATTKANALAGTAINLTAPTGGDTHYLTRIDPLDIVLNIQNSSDEAQLPLFPKIRVVADTGATDAVTLSGVFVSRRT